MINGYSYINLYLNECNNGSTISNIDILKNLTNNTINDTKSNDKYSNCLDKNEIIKDIGETIFYLRVAYIDFEIDHNNYFNPFKPYLKSDALMYTYKSKSRLFYYFKNIFYNTDVGEIDKNNILESTFVFDNYQITYPQTFTINESFGVFSILISNKGDVFNKSFPKIQSLIANIGGIIKGVTLFFEIILHFISNKSLFIYLANYLTDSSDLKKCININKQNFKIATKNDYNCSHVFNKNKEIQYFQNSNSNLNLNNNSNENFHDFKKNLKLGENIINEINKEVCADKDLKSKHISIPINLINENKKKNPLKYEFYNKEKLKLFDKFAKNVIKNKRLENNLKEKRQIALNNFDLKDRYKIV